VITLGLMDHAGINEARPGEMIRAVARGENPLLVREQTDYDRVLAFVFAKPPSLPPLLKRYLAKREVENRPFNAKIFKDLHGNWRFFDQDFPTLRTPTLVIWGAADRVFDVSAAHRSHELLPNSELVILENTGHMPMMEKPKETAAAIKDFIQRHGGV
jgi:abhydrolase domain-containing protein 6